MRCSMRFEWRLSQLSVSVICLSRSQIYPRSFADSDGDGVGDIRGIINHLEHLVDLGVTGFWLGPVFRSTMIGELASLLPRSRWTLQHSSNIFNRQRLRCHESQGGGPALRTGLGSDGVDHESSCARLENHFRLRRWRVNSGADQNLKFFACDVFQVPNQTSEQHPWFQLSAANTPGYEDYYIWRICPMENNARRYHNNWVGCFELISSTMAYEWSRHSMFFAPPTTLIKNLISR